MSKATLPAPARERGRIAPSKLAHFVRKTSRREEMSLWYQTVLEAEVILENENFSFLTYDEEHHRVAILAMPGLEPPPPNAAGTDHIAFTYTNLADLLFTYQRLKKTEIEPYWCINHGPTTSFYYRDPDGNAVELQIDNFNSAQETAEWMASGEFNKNPVGIVFDPDELIERFESGVPVSELTRRPPLPDGVSPFDMVRL
jgi:catechol-2,3-dioxygenase